MANRASESSLNELVEHQWNYLLIMMHLRGGTMSSYHTKVTSLIEKSKEPLTAEERGKYGGEYETRICTVQKTIYDLAKDMWAVFQGSPLVECEPPMVDYTNLGQPFKVPVRSDLPYLAIPKWDRMIVGMVEQESMESWIEPIKNCNYKMVFDTAKEGEGFIQSKLKRLLVVQTLGKCLLGYVTDGNVHVVTKMVGPQGSKLVVEIDVVTCGDLYDIKPEVNSAVALILARLAGIQMECCGINLYRV